MSQTILTISPISQIIKCVSAENKVCTIYNLEGREIHSIYSLKKQTLRGKMVAQGTPKIIPSTETNIKLGRKQSEPTIFGLQNLIKHLTQPGQRLIFGKRVDVNHLPPQFLELLAGARLGSKPQSSKNLAWSFFPNVSIVRFEETSTPPSLFKDPDI